MENKEKIRSLAENVWAYIAAFLRWGVLGLLVGGLGGFVGALFAKSVAWATAMRGANPWLLYLLPVGGLAIVGVYKLCRVSGVGTNEVFEGVRSNKGVSILLAPAIFLGTTITHLLGGSAGREGAALQIGGSVATFFGKLFRLNEEDRHILTMCGMSGVFAAVFGTPMAACVFAIEVVSVGASCPLRLPMHWRWLWALPRSIFSSKMSRHLTFPQCGVYSLSLFCVRLPVCCSAGRCTAAQSSSKSFLKTNFSARRSAALW